MSELLDIIISAVDEASNVFESITGSANDMQNQLTNIDGSEMQEVADGADQAEQEIRETDESIQDLNNDLSIIDSSMLLQLGQQVGEIGDKAEGMAQEMNEAAISVGQLATQTGIAEPEMVNLINTISNATFPNDEAMMYVKSLDQIGVASSNLGKSATDLDRINDAFGLGAERTNSLGQELSVLGVDMNNVSSSFNALAYANSNTVGGMEAYYTFLRRYDSQFKELGINVDQASVIIAAATQKFGGGKAALNGLNTALKESNGDTRALEQALGLQAGALDNATQLTGEYEGQLQTLASEEAEHKTLLDQLGAAWEDVSLSIGSVASPLLSIVGMVGSVGSFGLQVSGLQKLATLIPRVTSAVRGFSIAQALSNAIEGEGAIARVASAIGITTEAAAAEGATVAFGGLAVAEGAALWPILAIVAAIALFVAAAYELGKAFGWWTDVSTMLEAIQAGITKLWNAFINHPDVQAVINTLTNAWNILSTAIQTVTSTLSEFFGVAEGGDFDIVAMWIHNIGAAWEAMTLPLRLVVEAFQFLYDGVVTIVTELYERVKPTLDGIYSAFLVVWNGIVSFLMPVINNIMVYVNLLINVFNQFRNGQISLPSAIIAALQILWNGYNTIMNQIAQLVLQIATRIISYGVRMGSQFVNRIISYIRTLPGRVYSGLVAVVSSINSAIQSWITAATSKVSSLISSITSPFSGVAGAISGALSGVVSAITAPFEAAWNKLEPIVSKIQEGMELIGARGGEESYGRASLLEANVSSTNSPVTVDHNLNVTLDLKNVPSGMDSDTLIAALTDRKVLSALTGSSDFQLLDGKAKERLNLKVNRSRGV